MKARRKILDEKRDFVGCKKVITIYANCAAEKDRRNVLVKVTQ